MKTQLEGHGARYRLMTKVKDEKYTSLGCLSCNINKDKKKGKPEIAIR